MYYTMNFNKKHNVLHMRCATHANAIYYNKSTMYYTCNVLHMQTHTHTITHAS